ncbi:hypothetical protein QTP86_002740 [Hemibagrus guttatus]|nr:hypothetical protein QTP86_002740 [Hemibagrus guttatus]
MVRQAMLYGLETVSLRKRQESELEVAELKMLSTLNFIPDQLRPGLTTTTISAVDLQGEEEEFVRNVLEVKKVSDRVMSLKLEIEGVILNVVSGYAPQVGCELEEKERFWSRLYEVTESIPTGERVVIGVYFNGHVGEGNTGDEEVMGKFGVK